ncbi:galactokinase [Tessaracoccus oleiagri]|uniref:Galactokinase n=1 Tax=Tessaracoccus oleiagri TaxID=686624 RepID=A0A1G9LZ33_9ACTN|nr:galactokinase [Tessaracoccus oleiagri]SDL67021.1 galactokinase [Tessaracoccus oleiagri]
MAPEPSLLAEEFRRFAGQDPEGLWFGPGRVNLIGEHTDYNEGFVLPFAIEQRAVVAAARRDDGRLVLRSLEVYGDVDLALDGLRPGGDAGWSAYLAGVHWALSRAGHEVGGATMVLSSDVPLGAGLSSSAAIECAAMAALVDLYGLDVAALDRAKLAQVAENAYVGAPTGILDQAASTLCKEGHGLFMDCRTLETRDVPLPLADHGLEILVLDTRTPHSHVDGEYGARRAACEEAARLLGVPALRDVTDPAAALQQLDDPLLRKRVRHVVTENQRVLEAVAVARDGDLERLGPLLDASHASMRDDYEITVPTVDLAVDVAREEGALGARMTGGGFGGCIIALAPSGAGDPMGRRIAEAFAIRGHAEPRWFVASPSAGAGRLA